MGQSLHHAIPDLVEFENDERLVKERSEGELSDEIGTYDTRADAGSKTQAIQKTIRIDREKLDAHHRKRVVEKTVSLNAEEIAAALNRWRTQAVTESETEPKTKTVERHEPLVHVSRVHRTIVELRTEEATKSRWSVVGLAIGFAVVGACIFVFA
ncbi:MAG: hypothetical protein ACREYC_06065 [Gammaproteobacteria bacterium]